MDGEKKSGSRVRFMCRSFRSFFEADAARCLAVRAMKADVDADVVRVRVRRRADGTFDVTAARWRDAPMPVRPSKAVAS